MRKLICGLVVGSAGLASPLHAACASLACTDILITRVITDRTGEIFIQPSATIPSPLDFGCTADAGIYFGIDMTTANAKELYAHVLSAHLLNRKVTLKVVSGTSGYCYLRYIYTST